MQLQVCFQVAKVSRPVISVSKMTETGELHTLRKKDESLVVTILGATVARFKRKGYFYVAMMKVWNSGFKHFPWPAGH